jgi:hypothetical protein
MVMLLPDAFASFCDLWKTVTTRLESLAGDRPTANLLRMTRQTLTILTTLNFTGSLF